MSFLKSMFIIILLFVLMSAVIPGSNFVCSKSWSGYWQKIAANDTNSSDNNSSQYSLAAYDPVNNCQVLPEMYAWADNLEKCITILGMNINYFAEDYTKYYICSVTMIYRPSGECMQLTNCADFDRLEF